MLGTSGGWRTCACGQTAEQVTPARELPVTFRGGSNSPLAKAALVGRREGPRVGRRPRGLKPEVGQNPRVSACSHGHPQSRRGPCQGEHGVGPTHRAGPSPTAPQRPRSGAVLQGCGYSTTTAVPRRQGVRSPREGGKEVLGFTQWRQVPYSPSSIPSDVFFGT